MTWRIPSTLAHSFAADEAMHWVLRLGDDECIGLSETGYAILRACDGVCSLDEAAERLADQYGWPRAQLDASVQRFASELVTVGLLEEVRE